jgi:hypothetical protein
LTDLPVAVTIVEVFDCALQGDGRHQGGAGLAVEERRSSWFLTLPPVLAFGLFLVYFFQIRGQPFVQHLVANPLVYDDQARQILKEVPPSQPFFMSPLYPAFVAIIYFLTEASRSAVLLCQGVLLAVNVWLVGLITSRLASRTVAAVASLLMVFCWSFYYFAGELLPVTLCVAFLLAGTLVFLDRRRTDLSPVAYVALAAGGILFLVRAVPAFANLDRVVGASTPFASSRVYLASLLFFLIFAAGVIHLLLMFRRSRRLRAHINLLASGLLLGISALVWSGTMFAIGLLTLRVVFERPARGLRTGVFALAVAVPVAASLVHNLALSGDVIPVTSSFGVNLFIGNNGESDGMNPFAFGKGDQVRQEADRKALAGAERSTFFRDRALEYIRSEPVDWLKLMGRKFLISIGAPEVDNNADIAERRSAWQSLFLPVLSFGMIFPLALVGLVRIVIVRREALPLVLGYTGFLLVGVVFFACERFRLPGTALLIPMAAIGLQALVRQVIRRDYGEIALSIALIAAAGLVSNFDYFGIAESEFASITVNKAHVQRNAGNLEEARSLAFLALVREPENAGAYFQLGAIEETQGNKRKAAAYYLDSLERDPFFFGPYAGCRRILTEARVNLSYLDDYVNSLIAKREHLPAKARLNAFLAKRLP